MGYRGIGSPALILASVLLFNSCIEMKSGVVVKSGPSLKALQNCPLPNSKQVARVARSLASAATAVTPESCAQIERFECYRRVFSPLVPNEKRNEQECANVAAFGGDFCVSLPVQYYDTSEAASRPDTNAAALQPGGDYNRSEYVCHQRELRDGDVVLASGLGESLKEALLNAHSECTAVAPRISALQSQGEAP